MPTWQILNAHHLGKAYPKNQRHGMPNCPPTHNHIHAEDLAASQGYINATAFKGIFKILLGKLVGRTKKVERLTLPKYLLTRYPRVGSEPGLRTSLETSEIGFLRRL